METILSAAEPKNQWTTRLRNFWRIFSKNRMGIVGFAMLVIIIFVAVFAPFIAPYDKSSTAGISSRRYLPTPQPRALVWDRRCRAGCIHKFCLWRTRITNSGFLCRIHLDRYRRCAGTYSRLSGRRLGKWRHARYRHHACYPGLAFDGGDHFTDKTIPNQYYFCDRFARLDKPLLASSVRRPWR